MISLDEMRKMAPSTAYPASTTKMDYDEELAALYGEDDGDYTPLLLVLKLMLRTWMSMQFGPPWSKVAIQWC
jgi:hypothetical protein